MPQAQTYQSEFTGQEMDARFAAVAQLTAALEAPTTVVAQKYVKPASGIPSTDMDEDVQAALAKANTAIQSLADYYTKSEVDQLLAAINGMDYVDVAALPTASASTMGKIYLVGPDGSGYYAYYYTSYDGSAYSWVGPLGTTEINLAGYASKAELNQLRSEVDEKADRIFYALYKNSYIYKNTVYIDSLLIYKQGVVGREISVKNTFKVGALYLLVVNRETGVIRISSQNNVTTDEDILLISTGDGFLPTGKLVGDSLLANWYDVELTIAESNKGITNTGQKVTASGYSISTPFFISAGNKVLITTSGHSFSALSKVENGVYTPIITYGNDGITAARTSYATIENSGYYVVSSANFKTRAFVATSKDDSEIINSRVSDTLVAGAVWSATSQIGEVYQLCDGAQNKYFLSQRFLAINGETDNINSITLSKSMPYYLLQYDKDFHFIGTALPSTNTTTLVNSCRFVKICAGNSTNKDYSKVIVTFDLSTRETPSWAFNGANDFTASPKILFRTYEVNEPFVTDNCEGEELTTNYRGIQTRIFNWGYIFLPKNYSRTGKPSPVIIHCHGTSGVVFNQQSLPYNTKYLEFLASCGYAVIGCSTFTSKYSNQHDDGDFPSPLAHSCYYNLWEYMTSEFNLDKSGAYIFGYSAGGMNTILFTQSKQIPIKAAAVLAGSVDLISNMRILADYCNEHFFGLIGLPGQDLPTGLAEDGTRKHPIAASVKGLVLANKDKFTGRNPFNFNSDLDYWSFFDHYASVNNTTSVLKNDSFLNELVTGAKVYFNTPIKFWHAVDDTNVPIQIARWWRTMVMNGGGLCYMRELPAGCGAHYAVGYTGDESLTPMVDYLTPFGDTINAPVAYAEMVDWFKRY